jgi:hypothetical protein
MTEYHDFNKTYHENDIVKLGTSLYRAKKNNRGCSPPAILYWEEVIPEIPKETLAVPIKEKIVVVEKIVEIPIKPPLSSFWEE